MKEQGSVETKKTVLGLPGHPLFQDMIKNKELPSKKQDIDLDKLYESGPEDQQIKEIKNRRVEISEKPDQSLLIKTSHFNNLRPMNLEQTLVCLKSLIGVNTDKLTFLGVQTQTQKIISFFLSKEADDYAIYIVPYNDGYFIWDTYTEQGEHHLNMQKTVQTVIKFKNKNEHKIKQGSRIKLKKKLRLVFLSPSKREKLLQTLQNAGVRISKINLEAFNRNKT